MPRTTRDENNAPSADAPSATPPESGDARTGAAAGAPPFDVKAMFIATLKSLSPAELSAILRESGAVPTTMGMTPEVFQAMAAAMQATSATAVRETLRQERKENPNYPERSVFHPEGKFDDTGRPLAAKVTFRRATFFQGVRLGGELESALEIELFNRFTEDKDARNGNWTARIENRGRQNEKLLVQIPSKTVDDRMENSLPLSLILRELLDGSDAVNPDALQRQIAEMQAQIKVLTAAKPAA